jgi:uncharacterized membrane protein YoaK (UPF0700 family)
VSVRDALLIGLTVAAGGVDAISYLGLGQIFTANMTGNTVLLALAVAQQNLAPVTRTLLALAGFAIGAFAGGIVLGREPSKGLWQPRATSAILLEFLILLGFSIIWILTAGRPAAGPLYLLIALSSISMGLQAACARSFALRGVTTTVLTTALTGFMADLAALGISGPDQRRWAGVVLGLFAGATVTGVLMVNARELAPLLPAVIVGAVWAVAFAKTM